MGTHTLVLKDGFSWIQDKIFDQKKERIIGGSDVRRARGNPPHSIQVSILLVKGNLNVNLPGEHFSYCLIWDGWDFTKELHRVLIASWLCAGHLLDAWKSCCDMKGCFQRPVQEPAPAHSPPHPSSLCRASENQEQAYSPVLIRLSE